VELPLPYTYNTIGEVICDDVKVGEQALNEVEFVNSDECHLCNRDGELLCCESCHKAYHRNCVGFLGDGDYICVMCRNEEAGRFEEILADATCACCRKSINTVER
jgi:hypothetical protein